MPRTALALAASVLALAARSEPAAPTAPAEPPPSPPAAPAEPAPSALPAPAKPPVARGAVLEEVSGTVREVDRKGHRLQVDTASGPVTLSIDRNTMVYTAGGLATVLDVTPGVQIRAGRNADFLAYWVQVRTPTRRAQEAQSTPGQGTGPAGGGSAPAGEGGGSTPGGASPPSAVPGGVPPGSASPPGAVPAR
jgi:hypothetical protein